MRTTVKINDQLLREAKARAARSGATLSAVVEDALRESFGRRREADRRPVDLPTFAGSHLRPGVDLDDGVALIDRMDGTSS